MRYDPERRVRPEVDFVAFPYEVYPFHLVEGDPPWSLSVMRTRIIFGTTATTISGMQLLLSPTLWTVPSCPSLIAIPTPEAWGFPNVLSWRVQDWQYDTLYEVEIENVIFSDGLRTNYAYSVFIERDNLEE